MPAEGDLASVADALYALPPAKFTSARNERAKETRSQSRELADQIKALPKPSTAAWVVNMLVRYDAEQLTQVLDLGAALRSAQENLAGDELRELTRQRRQLTHAVSGQARVLAQDLGVRVSEAVAGQVEETLRAAMTDEGAAQAVLTGQLLDALSTTGVEALDVSAAVAVPAAIGTVARPASRPVKQDQAERPQLKVVPGQREQAGPQGNERKLQQAREAVEAAETDIRGAEKKLAKTRRQVAKLEARSLELTGQLEEVRRRAGDLEHELENVDDALSDAEDRRDDLEEQHSTASAALEEARADVDKLSESEAR